MAAKSKPSMFSVFRSRSFTLLWIGQLISAIGSSLTTLAASILVFRITGSTLSVGLMLIATAPTVLIGLFAGVIVDRYDRKRILLGSDLLRAILIFLIPILIPLNIAWLYVIVALTSSITQFFDSAHASVLPETKTDEELASANSLMAISSVGAQRTANVITEEDSEFLIIPSMVMKRLAQIMRKCGMSFRLQCSSA